MSADDDHRQTSYLAGEADGSLPAYDRASLDELRALLASPALWVQPLPSLEDDTVARTIPAPRFQAPAPNPRRKAARPRFARSLRPFAAAVAAAALVAIVIVLAVRGERASPERFAMVVSGPRSRLARTEPPT